jgi:hypothetical protein
VYGLGFQSDKITKCKEMNEEKIGAYQLNQFKEETEANLFSKYRISSEVKMNSLVRVNTSQITCDM